VADERRVTVVTGASQGIGEVIANAFGSVGDAVVLAARNTENLERVAEDIHLAGGEALVLATDVTDTSSVEYTMAKTMEVFGRIDAVVANSGVGGPSGVLWELDPNEWDSAFEVNVKGVFLTARAAIPHMIHGGAGSFVIIGSISGKRPLFGRTAYTSTKAALIGLTRTLALEAGPHNIRVNLISPGFVAGPRIEWVIAAQAKARGITADAVRREFEAESPLGQLTSPQAIADAAVYLASPQAASITGADLNVNSGVVMY
jgi:NAD(P)-dependent dehydrogenase (short-subunit alcohol dehydrogenase family)